MLLYMGGSRANDPSTPFSAPAVSASPFTPDPKSQPGEPLPSRSHDRPEPAAWSARKTLVQVPDGYLFARLTVRAACGVFDLEGLALGPGANGGPSFAS